MIRTHRGIRPKVAASAYIDPSAQVIGDVEVGERASIWSNASVRGDVHRIRIGEESNVQDNCVLHGERGQWPVIVGKRVTIGHSAVLLSGSRSGAESLVAVGALAPEAMDVPPNSVVVRSRKRSNRNYIDYRQEYLDEQSS